MADAKHNVVVQTVLELAEGDAVPSPRVSVKVIEQPGSGEHCLHLRIEHCSIKAATKFAKGTREAGTKLPEACPFGSSWESCKRCKKWVKEQDEDFPDNTEDFSCDSLHLNVLLFDAHVLKRVRSMIKMTPIVNDVSESCPSFANSSVALSPDRLFALLNDVSLEAANAARDLLFGYDGSSLPLCPATVMPSSQEMTKSPIADGSCVKAGKVAHLDLVPSLAVSCGRSPSADGKSPDDTGSDSEPERPRSSGSSDLSDRLSSNGSPASCHSDRAPATKVQPAVCRGVTIYNPQKRRLDFTGLDPAAFKHFEGSMHQAQEQLDRDLNNPDARPCRDCSLLAVFANREDFDGRVTAYFWPAHKALELLSVDAGAGIFVQLFTTPSQRSWELLGLLVPHAQWTYVV